ncbi:hypothetical protein JXD38_11445 [candidate division WOR-3 bacterium]|nr:hypothetical protein [candidate division WOR-3 bacterium]
MLKRIVLLAFVVVAVAFMGSCTKATKLVGTLILQTGQTGDVQNCKVQLFVSSDLTGSPVMEVASQQNTAVNSPFEFKDPVEGYYYLIAWKDLNGDGVVSDKDIVGIHGGTYTPGQGGTQVTVKDGQTTDVGNITMLIYKQLVINASGSRQSGGTETKFSYSFNYDVNVTSLTITFPGYSPIVDAPAPGAKTAGTAYDTDTYNVGGGQMPTGAHTLQFIGTWESNAFDITVTVNIG